MVSAPPTIARDQRRSPRIRHELLVELHEKQGTRRLHAVDVARHGLFLATDDPPHERHLVQLTVHLPQGPIKAAASVMRTLKHDNHVDGVGVQFFALSGDAKQRWDDFIFALQRTTPSRGVTRPPALSPAASRGPMTAPPLTDPDDFDISTVKSQPPALALPYGSPERDLGAAFLVKLKTVERLRDFAHAHLAAGGTVLFTPVLRAEGDLVTLIVVHPKTDEEFRLPGFVHEAHSDRPKRLDIHFHGVTPAVLQSFADYVETGRPPAQQLEAPVPLPRPGEGQAWPGQARPGQADDDLDLDVVVLEEEAHEAEERVWREPADASKDAPRSKPRLAPALAPAPNPAADPGFKPHTFLVRCDRMGDGCTAEPYAVDLGPCRGVLGLLADHTAFLSNKTGRVVTAPRFVDADERARRAQVFIDRGGRLEASVDVHTLLAIAPLGEPVKDPDTGAPLKQTRAVERLEHAARRLVVGDPPARSRVQCAGCKVGHLTVERVEI